MAVPSHLAQPTIRDVVRQATGVKGELCGAVEKFITQYFDDKLQLGVVKTALTQSMAERAKSAGISPEEAYYCQFVCDHCDIATLQECAVLFAIGIQLAANVHGDVDGVSVTLGAAQDGGKAYYHSGKNEIALTASGLGEYICNKNAKKITNDYVRAMADRHHENNIEKYIETGAEEYHHAFQHKNPEKWAALETELKEAYGERWSMRRGFFMSDAYSSGTMKEFAQSDPIEKDAHNFMETQLENRVKAAIYFKQSQVVRAY